MDDNIQEKINELREKAKKHKQIANEYRQKIEEIRNKPLESPQDGLETVGDTLDYIKTLELAKTNCFNEIQENQERLRVYKAKKDAHKKALLNTKIYELPLTFDMVIKYLCNGTMSFKDLIMYIKRISSRYNNKND